MKKTQKKKIAIYILILIVLYLAIYIVPKVSGAMVFSYVAEYGQMKIYDETKAYIVRNENVYLAGSTGETNYYFEEGDLVHKGGKIMDIKANNTKETADKDYQRIVKGLGEKAVEDEGYRTRDVGVVSYYADGYEASLTPKTMGKKSYSYYESLSQEDVVSLKRDHAVAGEPVFKIVDRTKWYMVCFVDQEHLERYEEGNRVSVEFDNGYVDACVLEAKKVDGKVRVLLSTNYYHETFEKTRVASVSLITYNENGVIIENSSIGEEDGQKGVYVKGKNGEFFFVPIMIYATDGEKSLIADDFYYDQKKDGEMVLTVEVYDEILKNADSH